MKISKVPVSDAIGLALSHDLTQIDAKTHYKGARFKRGHIVKNEDLELLRSMGREHLNMIVLEEGEVHEDIAAVSLGKAMAGRGVMLDGPSEGKCTLISTCNGILSFDREKVDRINRLGEWIVATLDPYERVTEGQVLAGFRVLPLAVQEKVLSHAIELSGSFEVRAFKPLTTGLVTVGNELADSIVKDAFKPKLEKKLLSLGGTIRGHLTVHDDESEIAMAINELCSSGCEIVICTAGMSVDADDRTPCAIRSTCDEVIFQGIPVLPGSMLMLARKENTFIIGAPACVVHNDRTSLDPVLDRLFAGLVPDRDLVATWGVGGLCRNCDSCIYPGCSFSSRP